MARTREKRMSAKAVRMLKKRAEFLLYRINGKQGKHSSFDITEGAALMRAVEELGKTDPSGPDAWPAFGGRGCRMLTGQQSS